MSLYVHELTKFEFFLQNMSRSLQTIPQKAPKRVIFGLKIAEQWDYWAKNYSFVCQHVSQCLRSTQLFSVHLFCKIAQVQVDLLAFYPENGHFYSKNTQKVAFLGNKCFYPVG